MATRNWFTDYDAACAELKLAQEQCRVAERMQAQAAARYGRAESEVNRLFAAMMKNSVGAEQAREEGK